MPAGHLRPLEQSSAQSVSAPTVRYRGSAVPPGDAARPAALPAGSHRPTHALSVPSRHDDFLGRRRTWDSTDSATTDRRRAGAPARIGRRGRGIRGRRAAGRSDFEVTGSFRGKLSPKLQRYVW